MAKNTKKVKENKEKAINNCVIKAKRENGYINFSLDIDDIQNVKVRLITPNVKLASLLYHKINNK